MPKCSKAGSYCLNGRMSRSREAGSCHVRDRLFFLSIGKMSQGREPGRCERRGRSSTNIEAGCCVLSKQVIARVTRQTAGFAFWASKTLLYKDSNSHRKML